MSYQTVFLVLSLFALLPSHTHCHRPLSYLLDYDPYGSFARTIHHLATNTNGDLNAIAFNDDLSAYQRQISFLFEVEVTRRLLFTIERLTSDSAPSSNHTDDYDCHVDLLYMLDGVRNKNATALQVVDAFGKPPAGIRKGNFIWPGDYHECMNAAHTGDFTLPQFLSPNNTVVPVDFHGQYALLSLQSNATAHQMHPQATGPAFGLAIALCLPRSCTSKLINETLQPIVKYVSNNTLSVDIYVPGNTQLNPTAYSAVIAICILCVFSVMVIFGTAYDYYLQTALAVSTKRLNSQSIEPQSDDGSGNDHRCGTESADLVGVGETKNSRSEKARAVFVQILLSFSAYSNGAKLLSVSKSDVGLAALHGVRFLSMAWVILGHTFYFSVNLLKNPLDFVDLRSKGFAFQAILNALFSVDTFFLLSGCLTAYTFLRVTQNNVGILHKVKFWLLFYFHRWRRLTPTYMFILRVYVGLFPFIGSGPFWPKDGFEYKHCETTWWTNFLYINNFVYFKHNGTDGSVQREFCMGWTWYLANDMQFFIISPFVLYPLARAATTTTYRRIWLSVGLGVAGLYALVSIVTNAAITYVHNYPANNFPPDLQGVAGVLDDIYIKPWCRIGPYAVGLVLGYLLSVRKYRIPRVLVPCCWFLSFCLCSSVIFGLYPEYVSTNFTYSLGTRAFYQAGSRVAWGLGVAWVIYACVNGYGGPVNTFLSWPVWVPLSRLTFCAYLVHPMLMYLYYFTRVDTIYYTNFTMVWFYFGFLFSSYAVAFVLSILFESPFIGIERVIFGAKRSE